MQGKIIKTLIFSVFHEISEKTVNHLEIHKKTWKFAFYAKGRPESLEMDKELLLFRAPAAECALLR